MYSGKLGAGRAVVVRAGRKGGAVAGRAGRQGADRDTAGDSASGDCNGDAGHSGALPDLCVGFTREQQGRRFALGCNG